MVAKYHNKQEKSQEAKRRSTVERRLVRELERAMDVDLFLEIQSNWAKDSPHGLVILHKMFCHDASEGQKEAESAGAISSICLSSTRRQACLPSSW